MKTAIVGLGNIGRQVALNHLITASGFAPVLVGGVNQSIRIEVFGDLHELGNLGRLVSVREAAQLLLAS